MFIWERAQYQEVCEVAKQTSNSLYAQMEETCICILSTHQGYFVGFRVCSYTIKNGFHALGALKEGLLYQLRVDSAYTQREKLLA